MRSVIIALASLSLVACGNNSPDRVQSTRDGTFYLPWWGGIYEIRNGHLFEVNKIAQSPIEKTYSISQTIPNGGYNSFPAIVTGSIKLDDDIRKIKLTIDLTNNGTKMPTVADRVAFINELRGTTPTLTSLSLSFTDKDAFMAAPMRTIPIGDDGWTYTFNDQGQAVAQNFAATEPWDSPRDGDVTAIQLLWAASQPATPLAAQTDASAAASDAAMAAKDAEQAAAEAESDAAQAPPNQ